MPENDPVRYMADVKIRKAEDGAISVLLNGEEMNMQILANSLKVEFPQPEWEYGTALVTFTLHADIDIDFPKAEVEAR